MRLTTNVSSIFDRIIDYLAIVAIVLMAFAWLLVCVEVFIRYFLDRSIVWSAELTGYILVHITFLSTTWLLKREGHVNVDIVLNQLNPQNRAFLNMSTSFLCVILCLAITWFTAEALWLSAQQGLHMVEHFLMPPKWAVHAVIPVGSLLLMVQFIRRGNGYLRSWRENRQTKV